MQQMTNLFLYEWCVYVCMYVCMYGTRDVMVSEQVAGVTEEKNFTRGKRENWWEMSY